MINLKGECAECSSHCITNHSPAAGPQQWAGCTALASLVWGGRLFVANAGDCRAVLCRGGEAVPLSRDHTAELDAERQRVHN